MENDQVVMVLRVVQYVGTRKAVQEQIERSLHGTQIGGTKSGPVRITATTVGEFPTELPLVPEDRIWNQNNPSGAVD